MDDRLGPASTPEIERALERLFRLTVSRRLHNLQVASVGAEVTRAGYAVLRAVDDVGELPMKELARQCSMDPGAAARLVRTLQQDGLVDRVPGSTDGRVVVVRLTDRGRQVHRAIAALRTAHLDAVLDDWSDGDRAELTRLVDRLVDDLRSTPVGDSPTETDPEHRGN